MASAGRGAGEGLPPSVFHPSTSRPTRVHAPRQRLHVATWLLLPVALPRGGRGGAGGGWQQRWSQQGGGAPLHWRRGRGGGTGGEVPATSRRATVGVEGPGGCSAAVPALASTGQWRWPWRWWWWWRKRWRWRWRWLQRRTRRQAVRPGRLQTRRQGWGGKRSLRRGSSGGWGSDRARGAAAGVCGAGRAGVAPAAPPPPLLNLLGALRPTP